MRPYVCTDCGAKNCKLWREYQTFADYTKMLCAECVQRDQDKVLNLEESNACGWYVPAVPAPGDTFWGYTTMPQDGVDWWENLPLREGEEGTRKC